MEGLARTSIHEAGHAVCAHLLSATTGAGPASIVASGSFAGICFAGRSRRYPKADLDGLARPWPLVPARVKRFYETEIMVLLAGQAAVELHTGREVPELPREVAAAEPVALPAREALQLEQAAASDDHHTDLGRAVKIAMAMHFDDLILSELHCRFLERETEALMAGKRAMAMVEALAGELLSHRTLPAARWKAVLQAAA